MTASAAAPAFSLIIPHRDDLAGLARTLAALARLDAASPACELIVADNGSAAGLEAVAQVAAAAGLAMPVRVIDAGAVIGAGPARNLAARVANGAALAFIDCDCLPPPGWLIAAAAALARHAVAGGLVQVMLPPGPARRASPAEAFDMLFGFNVTQGFARDGLLLTANLAVRAGVFRAVGDFRNHLPEDLDWCHRAAAQGHGLALVPGMALGHVALDDARRLAARWDRVMREAWAYHRLRGRGRASWLWYLAKVAASPLLHAPRALFGPIGPADRRLRAGVLRLLLAIRWRRVATGVRVMRAADVPLGC